MKVVVMAVSPNYAGKWPLEQLAHIGRPNTFDTNRWSVGSCENWIAVSIANDVRQDYEPDILDSLLDGLTDPTLYLVEASKEQTIASYIGNLPDVSDIRIDNTHGLIASLSHFKYVIRSNEKWIYVNEGGRAANVSAGRLV